MDRRLLAALFHPGSRLSLEADLADADLLARFAATADDAAFAEIVRRHGPLVWGVCRNLLPNLADAEDAFQATFLALVQSPRSVRRAASLPGFLHGVAVRVAAKLRRGAVRRKKIEARAAVPETDSPVPESAWGETYALVQAEVQRLPAVLRTAFLVCEVGGVPQPEAARQLGWKLGTLSGRLTKARQRLMTQLTKRGIGPAAAMTLVGVGATGTPAAVPWRLVEAVGLFPKAAAGAVPVLLVQLATEGSIVGMSQLKLWAAATVTAGGLAVGVGPAVLPVADAQGFGQGGAAGGGEAKPPAEAKKLDADKGAEPKKPADRPRPTVVARPDLDPATTWEYEYAEPPRNLADFKKLLADKGKQGWEYSGPTLNDGVKGTDDTKLVFKRPVKPKNRVFQYGNTTFNVPGGFSPGKPEVLSVEPAFGRLGGFTSPRAGGDAAQAAEFLKTQIETLRAALQDDVDRLTKELEERQQALRPGAGGADPTVAVTQQKVLQLRLEEAMNGLERLRSMQPPAPPQPPTPPRPAAPQLAPQARRLGVVPQGETRETLRLTTARTASEAAPVVIQLNPNSSDAAAVTLVPVIEASLGEEGLKFGGTVRVASLGTQIILFGATPKATAQVKQLLETLGVGANVVKPKAEKPAPPEKP